MPWGVAAAVAGGYIASQGAQSAAATQAAGAQQAGAYQLQATQMSLDQQRQMWEQSQKNLSPYMQQGAGAANMLGNLMGTSGEAGAAGYGSLSKLPGREDVMSQMAPNFEFLQQQGMQNLQASAAARGMLGTGQNLKDIVGYSQNMSENAYQQAYNNYVGNQTNQYNRLMGLTNIGQSSAAGMAAQGTQVSANMSNTAMAGAQAYGGYLTGAANAQAAGQMGTANAWGNAINSGANNYFGQQNYNAWLAKQ